jgi:amino-acid N-acetyltransferase
MTQEISNAVVRKASEKEDLPQVLSLLQDADLPTEGVEMHFNDFLVATDQAGVVVGVIGMERYADGTALLRSAVVEASLRNAGVGSLLYQNLIGQARSSGIRRVILLTNTAETYFARKGFRVIARSSITGPILQSSEFTHACPESAVCMERLLD